MGIIILPSEGDTFTVDVQTLNMVTRLLHQEILKYPPTSEASIALFKFKELVSQWVG